MTRLEYLRVRVAWGRLRRAARELRWTYRDQAIAEAKQALRQAQEIDNSIRVFGATRAQALVSVHDAMELLEIRAGRRRLMNS